MGVGPACQPRSPLAFLSGGWATFPTCGTDSSPQGWRIDTVTKMRHKGDLWDSGHFLCHRVTQVCSVCEISLRIYVRKSPRMHVTIYICGIFTHKKIEECVDIIPIPRLYKPRAPYASASGPLSGASNLYSFISRTCTQESGESSDPHVLTPTIVSLVPK